MDYNKKYPEKFFSYNLCLLMQKVSKPSFIKRVSNWFSDNYFSAVMTNVSGTDEERSFLGNEIKYMIIFVPPPHGFDIYFF
jgi:hypothetical protein